MPTTEVRPRDGAVPLRGHRLDHVEKGVAYEIPADFFSDVAMASMLLWTNISNRLRVKIGAGAYQVVGVTRATAVDLGSFTAGETKLGTLEVTVPGGTDTRHEELTLNVGQGID